MGDLENLLSQLRTAAEHASGQDWLREQVTGLLEGVRQRGNASPTPASTRARRSRPPERSTPDRTPRVRRRSGSSGQNPSGPSPKRSSQGGPGGPGRNPPRRRNPRGTLGGDVSAPPSPPIPSNARERSAAPLASPSAGVRRGRSSAAELSLSQVAAEAFRSCVGGSAAAGAAPDESVMAAARPRTRSGQARLDRPRGGSGLREDGGDAEVVRGRSFTPRVTRPTKNGGGSRLREDGAEDSQAGGRPSLPGRSAPVFTRGRCSRDVEISEGSQSGRRSRRGHRDASAGPRLSHARVHSEEVATALPASGGERVGAGACRGGCGHRRSAAMEVVGRARSPGEAAGCSSSRAMDARTEDQDRSEGELSESEGDVCAAVDSGSTAGGLRHPGQPGKSTLSGGGNLTGMVGSSGGVSGVSSSGDLGSGASSSQS